MNDSFKITLITPEDGKVHSVIPATGADGASHIRTVFGLSDEPTHPSRVLPREIASRVVVAVNGIPVEDWFEVYQAYENTFAKAKEKHKDFTFKEEKNKAYRWIEALVDETYNLQTKVEDAQMEVANRDPDLFKPTHWDDDDFKRETGMSRDEYGKSRGMDEQDKPIPEAWKPKPRTVLRESNLGYDHKGRKPNEINYYNW